MEGGLKTLHLTTGSDPGERLDVASIVAVSEGDRITLGLGIDSAGKTGFKFREIGSLGMARGGQAGMRSCPIGGTRCIGYATWPKRDSLGTAVSSGGLRSGEIGSEVGETGSVLIGSGEVRSRPAYLGL